MLWTLALVLWVLIYPRESEASVFPEFSGTTLTGQSVSRESLNGAPTVLIITPGRKGAASTRAWVKSLRGQLNPGVRVRDMIATSVPFFITDNEALKKAQAAVPKKYWNETWLVLDGNIEQKLGETHPGKAVYVYVVDSGGNVIDQVGDEPTGDKISEIKSTLGAATAVRP